MPLINISIEKGRPKNDLKSIINNTIESVQECLNLKKDDRNIRLTEYDSELFYTEPPYKLLIEISLFPGRTLEVKKKIFETIIDRLVKNVDFKKKEILILLNEQVRENWGLYGGIPANEIDFSFLI